MTTRITGGTHRGRKVRSRKGPGLRPTLELVRAAIYSMVGDTVVVGGRVLDLYAGTGSLGMEALSRGASYVDFVESNNSRCRDIKDSLKDFGFAQHGSVHSGRVERVLNRLTPGYRLVLAAPPYDDDPWLELMNILCDNDILAAGGVVVADHRRSLELADSYSYLFRERKRRYGDTAVSIYKAGVGCG